MYCVTYVLFLNLEKSSRSRAMLLSVSTDCSTIAMRELISILFASTVKASVCSASSLETFLELLMLMIPTRDEESREHKIMLIVIFSLIDFK